MPKPKKAKKQFQKDHRIVLGEIADRLIPHIKEAERAFLELGFKLVINTDSKGMDIDYRAIPRRIKYKS